MNPSSACGGDGMVGASEAVAHRDMPRSKVDQQSGNEKRMDLAVVLVLVICQ